MEEYSVKIGKCCNCKKVITKNSDYYTAKDEDKLLCGECYEKLVLKLPKKYMSSAYQKKEPEKGYQNQRKGQWLWNKIWDKVVDKAKKPESEKDILENEQLVSHHLWTMKDSEFDEMMSKRVESKARKSEGDKILKLLDNRIKYYDDLIDREIEIQTECSILSKDIYDYNKMFWEQDIIKSKIINTKKLEILHWMLGKEALEKLKQEVLK